MTSFLQERIFTFRHLADASMQGTTQYSSGHLFIYKEKGMKLPLCCYDKLIFKAILSLLVL